MADSKFYDIRRHWKLRGSQKYDFYRFLNNSNYGKVALFRDVIRKKDVAGKIVNEPREGEAYHWPTLRHVNVMTLIESIRLTEEIQIYMMPLLGMSLFEFIYQVRFYHEPYPFQRKKAYVQDILWGLDYLHDKKLCLMNLNEKNIWISQKTDTAIIGNFSSMVPLSQVTVEAFSLINLYKPPEVLNLKPKDYFNGIKAEMWACGVMIMQLFCGHALGSKLPFNYETAEAIITVLDFKEILTQDILFEANPGPDLPTDVALWFQRFLGEFLQLDPMLRVPAKIAATDAFLKDKIRFPESRKKSIDINPRVDTYKRTPIFAKIDQATQIALNAHEVDNSNPQFTLNDKASQSYIPVTSEQQIIMASGDGVMTSRIPNFFLNDPKNKDQKIENKSKNMLTRLCKLKVSNISNHVNTEISANEKQSMNNDGIKNAAVEVEEHKHRIKVQQIGFTTEKGFPVLDDDILINEDETNECGIADEFQTKVCLSVEDNKCSEQANNSSEVKINVSSLKSNKIHLTAVGDALEWENDLNRELEGKRTETKSNSKEFLKDFIEDPDGNLTVNPFQYLMQDLPHNGESAVRIQSSSQSQNWQWDVHHDKRGENLTVVGNAGFTNEDQVERKHEENDQSENVAWNFNYGKEESKKFQLPTKEGESAIVTFETFPCELTRNCHQSEECCKTLSTPRTSNKQPVMEEASRASLNIQEQNRKPKLRKHKTRGWFCLTGNEQSEVNDTLHLKEMKSQTRNKNEAEEILLKERRKLKRRHALRKYLLKRKTKYLEETKPIIPNMYDVEAACSYILSVTNNQVNIPTKSSKWQKLLCLGRQQ